MKIAAVTMVYNEALLLPYFLRHYEYLDEIHVLHETDSNDGTSEILEGASNVIIYRVHIEGGLDDIDKVNLINETLHGMQADWVYVLDCDEFIFPLHESPHSFLARQECDVVRAAMFQVYRHRSDSDLDPSLPPVPQRVHGDADVFSTAEGENRCSNALYIKPIVVKPSAEIEFRPGNHSLSSTRETSPEFFLGAHWAMADPEVAINRRLKNRSRISGRNRTLRMTWQHWNVTEEWIRQECEQHLDDPVIEELRSFGDGHMAHPTDTEVRQLRERGALLRSLEENLKVRNSEIRALKNAVTAKDSRIRELESTVTHRDAHLKVLENTVADKDAHIGVLQKTVADRDAHIGVLQKTVADRDAHIGVLQNTVADRDARIAELNQAMSPVIRSAARRAQRLLDWMLPVGSRRRSFAQRAYSLVTSGGGRSRVRAS